MRSPGSSLLTRAGCEAGERIERSYSFPDYGAGVGFVMQIALLAERRDHHPDIALSWGKVRVAWSTHDAGGLTALDLELAELTDRSERGLTPRVGKVLGMLPSELLQRLDWGWRGTCRTSRRR